MKRYITGLTTGVLLTTMIFIFMGTTQAQDDSLATIMTELDTYVQDQLGKDKSAGRFQLQSFQIERTHWHYMLDTATGELYRLEPSRTPGNAKWVDYFLSESDTEIRFETLRWISEYRLKEFLPKVENIVSDPELDYKTFEAALAGIAKPIPIDPACPGAMIAVFIPTTSPFKLNKGPPEFP